MKQKRKYILLSAIAFFAILTAGIVAYGALTKKNDIVHNHLHIATLRGDIKEEFIPKEDIEIGGSQEKNITVENTGNTGFFVRVMAFPEIHITLKDKDDNDVTQPLPATIGQEIIVDLGPDWVDGGDGYYYYKKKLPAKVDGNTDHVTQSLFTKVDLADDLDTTYENATFNMQIKSETVTAVNYQYRKVWWNLDVSATPTETALITVDDALKAIVGTP